MAVGYKRVDEALMSVVSRGGSEVGRDINRRVAVSETALVNRSLAERKNNVD